jgi:sugar phosphate isomerase/epimerase
MLEANFAEAIGFLAKLGYHELEVFGPYTFSDPAQIARRKALAPALGFSGSGFFGHSVEQARAIFKQHGMSVPSMHSDMDTLRDRMGLQAEAAHKLGATYVTLPAVPAEMRETLDDYKRTADVLNKIGADATRHGVKLAYHNHGYGIKPIDGQVPLELLLNSTDPAHVFLELDIFWTIAGGGDPVDYLTRYKGRYKMLHLKDMKEIRRFEGDGGGPDQWIKLFPYMTSLGNGAMDLPAILATARATGVEHYFVEQDTVANPHVALRESADYLLKHGFR